MGPENALPDKFLYYLLNKPYGVLSQFTREAPEHRTLGDLYDFPPDVYPVGRLDRDSEGLLILTNDGGLNRRLLDPAFGHRRTYLVQVEGMPEEAALRRLREGLPIRIRKKNYRTRPAQVRLLPAPPPVSERTPPVRFRKTVPDRWLELTLTEGKNRQVRRMCAAAGYPVLRLIRTRIEKVRLPGPEPGAVKEIDGKSLYQLLGMN